MERYRAENIAKRIHALLRPHTVSDLIHVAGSVRRGRPEVKDIEIVCVPKISPRDTNLFGATDSWQHSREFVEAARKLGPTIKGNIETGRYVQFDIQNTEGKHLIRLDLFMPKIEDYYRQLAIRTGPANYSKRIAEAWRRMGWVGTEDGLRREAQCEQNGDKWVCKRHDPTKPPLWTSEEEFFRWIEMNYIPPSRRDL